MLKSIFTGVGLLISIPILFVVLVLAGYAGTRFVQHFQAGVQSGEQNIQRHTINFVDSQNGMARNLIADYHKDEAAGRTSGDPSYQARLNDEHSQICGLQAEIDFDLVARDVKDFLAQHPCN